MFKVEFLEDFATKKKGDTDSVSGMVAANIIKRGIAKLAEDKPKAQPVKVAAKVESKPVKKTTKTEYAVYIATITAPANSVSLCFFVYVSRAVQLLIFGRTSIWRVCCECKKCVKGWTAKMKRTLRQHLHPTHGCIPLDRWARNNRRSPRSGRQDSVRLSP